MVHGRAEEEVPVGAEGERGRGGDQVAVHVTGRGTQGRGGRGECQPFSSTALIYNVVHAIAPSITSFDDPCISCLFFSNYHTRGELYAVCNFHWLVLCLPWVQVLGYPTCTVQTLRIYLAYTLNVRVHYENFLATMTSLITSTTRWFGIPSTQTEIHVGIRIFVYRYSQLPNVMYIEVVKHLIGMYNGTSIRLTTDFNAFPSR